MLTDGADSYLIEDGRSLLRRSTTQWSKSKEYLDLSATSFREGTLGRILTE